MAVMQKKQAVARLHIGSYAMWSTEALHGMYALWLLMLRVVAPRPVLCVPLHNVMSKLVPFRHACPWPNFPGSCYRRVGVRLWPERCPFPETCTTIFPTASTSSRSFNTSLWTATGEAMGTEVPTTRAERGQ